MENIKRFQLLVQGQVQGVGFRPFIWRLANKNNLSGLIRNTFQGVEIEIQGKPNDLKNFEDSLTTDLPPLARIKNLQKKELSINSQEEDFIILKSLTSSQNNFSRIFVAPDIAICSDCLEDIANVNNRRFNYAFTNCTNCGPRYTITRYMPYDRASTVMDCFPLCEVCSNEFSDVHDRRFHAQPIACPECGPDIWYVTRQEAQKEKTNFRKQQDALDRAANDIINGKIVALKGLGGFQLVCDAGNYDVVKTLRIRKNRPSKAFAVMAQNLASIRSFADISEEYSKFLDDSAKPIVLCPKKENTSDLIAENIAPDVDTIGIMLPYTPLHYLLLEKILKKTGISPVLVMTSGNSANEPICLGNREALRKLSSLADSWLLHNRDILIRVDDSVLQLQNQEDGTCWPTLLRRARGFTPKPILLKDNLNYQVLGTGAELKSTFCLTREDQAIVSQHIGDLTNPENVKFYESSLNHLEKLFEITPEVIVCDLHPNFSSVNLAKNLAKKRNLPVWQLQHHVAHACAVLGENHRNKGLVLTLDGSGLGIDNHIWGGELIRLDLNKTEWQRMGTLSSFKLPGGEAAIIEPWRIARSLQHLTGKMENTDNYQDTSLAIIDEIITKDINCFSTTSCGRLFDGISALCGLCHHKISYEGQAAMLLQREAGKWLKYNSSKNCLVYDPIIKKTNEMLELDIIYLTANLQDLIKQSMPVSQIAAVFHLSLAKGYAKMAYEAAQRLNIMEIGLSGGVFQNLLFTNFLCEFLKKYGLTPLLHKELPPGDACISFGQAIWGRSVLAAK